MDKHTTCDKLINLNLIIYILINLCITIFLSRSQWVRNYSHTVELRILPIVLCWGSITVGTGMRVIVFGFKRAKRIDMLWLKGVIKTLCYILLLVVIFVGYLVTLAVSRICNRDEDIIRFGFFEYVFGGAAVKTIIFITSTLFYGLGVVEGIEKTHNIFLRLSCQLKNGIKKMAIMSGVIIGAFFSGNFEYIALHANQTYMLWWYPIIVCMYMIFAEEIIRICAWNYDWEKQYADILNESGIAPNIETIPFPEK